MATVSYRIFLIALIAAMLRVHGYTLNLIPAWSRSERAPKTDWELRDQYVRLVNQDPLRCKPPAPNDIPTADIINDS